MAVSEQDYYQTDVYREQGGGALRSKDDGVVEISGGKVLKAGSVNVTGTEAVDLSDDLSSIDAAWGALGTDPGTDAGDPAFVTTEVSGTTLTLKVWQDDLSAGATATLVYYGAVGDPA